METCLDVPKRYVTISARLPKEKRDLFDSKLEGKPRNAFLVEKVEEFISAGRSATNRKLDEGIREKTAERREFTLNGKTYYL